MLESINLSVDDVMALSQAAVLLLFGLCGLIAVHAQFKVFKGDQLNQLELLPDLERLQIAARPGDMQIIELTESVQGAVVQESVSVNIDCLPWFNQNQAEGSMIRWTLVQLDEFGKEKGSSTFLWTVFSAVALCDRVCIAYWHH